MTMLPINQNRVPVLNVKFQIFSFQTNSKIKNFAFYGMEKVVLCRVEQKLSWNGFLWHQE